MSLLAIIVIAIVIPFVVMFLGFTWFFIRSRIAKLAATQKPLSNRSSTGYRTRLGYTPEVVSSSTTYAALSPEPVLGYKPTYKPLSHFLVNNEELTVVGNDTTHSSNLSVIPGISKELEQELHNLGYSSLEQIARWGRADVRAVSADLGIEQQLIEEVWIANARLLTAIRSTSYTN